MSSMQWMRAGALLAFLGVALGAFGAHALEGKLDERGRHLWQTAVSYQMWHALAILVVAGSTARGCFFAGTVIFSGTLYALALGAPRALGAVTPIGGLLFLAGWLAVIFKKGGAAADGVLSHFNL